MKLAFPLFVIGIAAEVVGMALPQYWPDAPDWIWGLFVWGGIATIIFAVLWLVKQHVVNLFSGIPRPPAFVSIRHAAIEAYETIGEQSLEGLADNGDYIMPAVLAMIAHAETGDIQLSGKESPSTNLTPIPRKYCDGNNLHQKDGEYFLSMSANGNGYTDIVVSRRDLKKHIKWRREGMA